MSKANPTKTINIRAFRAIDDPETSEAFVRRHHEVLKAHGICMITSARPDWVDDPDVYVVVAESEDGRMLGGVRIHKAAADSLLPVEAALGEQDSKVTSVVRREARKGTGEACGMWVAEDVEGRGVSTMLMRAVISIANQVGTRTLFAFCSDHTTALIRSMGFQIMDSLGDNGDFAYPSPEFTSRVFLMNAVNIREASTDNLTVINDLRKQPVQQRLEQGSFAVSYDLNISICDGDVTCTVDSGISQRDHDQVFVRLAG